MVAAECSYRCSKMLNGASVPDPLEIYFKICLEAAQACGPDAMKVLTGIEARLRALPDEDRHEVEEAVKRLTSFSGPGFHEHGPH